MEDTVDIPLDTRSDRERFQQLLLNAGMVFIVAVLIALVAAVLSG